VRKLKPIPTGTANGLRIMLFVYLDTDDMDKFKEKLQTASIDDLRIVHDQISNGTTNLYDNTTEEQNNTALRLIESYLPESLGVVLDVLVNL